MTLLITVPDVNFTDTDIPILRRDVIANDGTLDIFDAREPQRSWVKEGDPIEGVDTWRSLLTDNTASFAGAIGWDNGFTFDNTADIITLPSTFKRGASQDACIIFWTKVGTQVSTTGNGVIAWIGNTPADNQFLCFLDHNTTDGNTFITVNSGNGAAQIMVQPVSVLGASRLAQIAVSMELIGGVYVYKCFLNGVRISTTTTALTSLPQPTNQMRLGGTASGYTNAYVGTHLRALVDELSETTPEELVALDFATHFTRLAA